MHQPGPGRLILAYLIHTQTSSQGKLDGLASNLTYINNILIKKLDLNNNDS